MGFTNLALTRLQLYPASFSARRTLSASSAICPTKKNRYILFLVQNLAFSVLNRAIETAAFLHKRLPGDNAERSDTEKSTANLTISAISHLFFGDMTVIFGIKDR